MNNKLYGNLIFELSHPGRRAYSLPENRFGHHPLPDFCKREKDAELPECDEMTVVRHYTNHSENNFGVDTIFNVLLLLLRVWQKSHSTHTQVLMVS